MIHLTEQERRVIIFVSVTVFTGFCLSLSWKGAWAKISYLHILDDPSFYPRINLNKASFEELQALPRMNAALARSIIDYRQAHGAFKTIKDLEGVGHLRLYQVKRLSQYLMVR